MRKMILLVFVVCASIYAKTVRAPLPDAAYAAKTIAILNHTGTQQALDRAYQELTQWGRLAVISDPAKADIVLVIGSETSSRVIAQASPDGSTYVRHQNVLHVEVSFFLNSQHEPFFVETEQASLLRKSATKRGIDALRKRLESK